MLSGRVKSNFFFCPDQLPREFQGKELFIEKVFSCTSANSFKTPPLFPTCFPKSTLQLAHLPTVPVVVETQAYVWVMKGQTPVCLEKLGWRPGF